MFNDYDPYEHLLAVSQQAQTLDANLNELNEQVKQMAQLLEMVAEQTKHLTNGMIGLQKQNKILHARLTHLENPDD